MKEFLIEYYVGTSSIKQCGRFFGQQQMQAESNLKRQYSGQRVTIGQVREVK